MISRVSETVDFVVCDGMPGIRFAEQVYQAHLLALAEAIPESIFQLSQKLICFNDFRGSQIVVMIWLEENGFRLGYCIWYVENDFLVLRKFDLWELQEFASSVFLVSIWFISGESFVDIAVDRVFVDDFLSIVMMSEAVKCWSKGEKEKFT